MTQFLTHLYFENSVKKSPKSDGVVASRGLPPILRANPSRSTVYIVGASQPVSNRNRRSGFR
jgi:hypothetical protein